MTRLTAIGVLMIAALALGGSAWAYLTATGSGSGSGSASVTLRGVSITATAGGSRLLPTGSPTGDVTATATNPNSSTVHVNALTLDPSQGTSGFANADGCALSFTSDQQTNGGSGWTLPPNGTTAIELRGTLTMGSSADTGCQGRTFTIFLKAS